MKEKAATIIGLVIIIGFAVLVIYMIINLDHLGSTWSQAVYIFGSVEAIAFTATGYFFGREVHRERAESAEKNAQRSAEKAESAETKRTEAERRETEARTKGEALAAAIISRATPGGVAAGSEAGEEHSLVLNESLGLAGEEGGEIKRRLPMREGGGREMDQLAALASKLYPEMG